MKDICTYSKRWKNKTWCKIIKCTFIGYCDDQKEYKLFDPNSHRLLASRDMVFHENVNEDDKMNNTGVWRDIANYVKIEGCCKQE